MSKNVDKVSFEWCEVVEAATKPVDHICECGHRSSEHAEPQPNLSNPCRTGDCLCSGFNFDAPDPLMEMLEELEVYADE